MGKSGQRDGVEGKFLLDDLTVNPIGISGTIVNNTNQDMDYIAVIAQNNLLYVYENLPAGGSFDLGDEPPLYSMSNYYYGSHSYYSAYIYDFLWDIKDDGEYRKVSELAALGVGIQSVYPMLHADEFVIIGVTENWDKTVDDDCNEMPYGCLYMIQ